MKNITEEEARIVLDQWTDEIASLEALCVLDPDLMDDVSDWLSARPLVRHIFLKTCFQWSKYPFPESEWVGTEVTVNEEDPMITLTRLAGDTDVNITLVMERFTVDKWISAPVLAGLLDNLD